MATPQEIVDLLVERTREDKVVWHEASNSEESPSWVFESGVKNQLWWVDAGPTTLGNVLWFLWEADGTEDRDVVAVGEVVEPLANLLKEKFLPLRVHLLNEAIEHLKGL